MSYESLPLPVTLSVDCKSILDIFETANIADIDGTNQETGSNFLACSTSPTDNLEQLLIRIRTDSSFQVASLSIRQVLLLETMVGNYLCGVSSRHISGRINICCSSVTCETHSYQQKLKVHRRLPLEIIYLQLRDNFDGDILKSLQQYVELRDMSLLTDATVCYPLSQDVLNIHEEGVQLLGQCIPRSQSRANAHLSEYDRNTASFTKSDLLDEYGLLLNIRRSGTKRLGRPIKKDYVNKLSRSAGEKPAEVVSYLSLKLQPYHANDFLRRRELEQRFGLRNSMNRFN